MGEKKQTLNRDDHIAKYLIKKVLKVKAIE